MRRIYITFGGAGYDEQTARIVQQAPMLGAHEVWVYDDRWLMGTEFYELNRWLWDHKATRGFGWFAWKPFVILDALSKLRDGDMVLYTDADTYPIGDLGVLFDTCRRDEGFMLFSAVGCNNRQWCKRDCFIVMGQDEPRYHDAQHAVARFMLFMKGPWRVQQFLMEWLTYCVNPRATTFDPSVIAPELDGFREHRTEQAIFTLLVHKYGIRLYREACQFGESVADDRELYQQLFHQEYAMLPRELTGSKFRNIPAA